MQVRGSKEVFEIKKEEAKKVSQMHGLRNDTGEKKKLATQKTNSEETEVLVGCFYSLHSAVRAQSVYVSWTKKPKISVFSI